MTETKKRRGRPSKLTEEVLGKLEEAYLAGATDTQACFFAGITTDVLYNYQTKNPDFIKRKEALKSDLALSSKFQVKSAIINGGDKETAKWLLERLERETYSIKPVEDKAVKIVLELNTYRPKELKQADVIQGHNSFLSGESVSKSPELSELSSELSPLYIDERNSDGKAITQRAETVETGEK